jgi:hypothetical protein
LNKNANPTHGQLVDGSDPFWLTVAISKYDVPQLFTIARVRFDQSTNCRWWMIEMT